MRQVVLWHHPFCSKAVCRNSRLEPSSAWLFSAVASVSAQGEMARALHPQMKNIDAPSCSSGQMWSGVDLAQHIEPGRKQPQRSYSQMRLTAAEHQWVESQSPGHLYTKWQLALLLKLCKGCLCHASSEAPCGPLDTIFSGWCQGDHKINSKLMPWRLYCNGM